MLQFRQITLNLVYFLNVLLVFLLIVEDKVRLPVFLQVTGRMHPLVLHFPLVLLFVGIFLEGLTSRKNFQHPVGREITGYVFCFFALSAALTALFGFFLYQEGSYTGEEIFLHKWMGTGVSLLAVLTVWMKEKVSALYYNGTLAVSAICLTLAGHWGSEITHGQGFLTEPIRKQALARMIQIEHPDSAIVFRDVIQPILNEKCLNCHNANRAKNDLILADYQGIMKGGENEDAVVPGKAEESLMYKYISLPMEDTLHMPPSGKLQLDPEEIKLIGWWINTGASASEKYVNFSKADSIHTIMLTKFQPKKGLDLVDISFADQSKIKDLNNPYRTVQQIAATKPYIAVFLGGKKDFSAKDLTELEVIRKQIISIDLGNSNVKDDDLKNLAQFPHLQKLHLQNIGIGDASVQHLRGLRYLDILNLSGTKISARALDEVSGWKNLKKLYLYNTAIPEENIRSLKNAHPELQVYNTQFDLTDSVYNAQLTIPVCKIDSTFFRQRASIEIKPSRGRVKYFYTLDGTEPNSNATLYTEPFQVNHTGELKVMAVMEGWIDSKVATFPLLKLGITPDRILLESKTDPKFSAKTDSVLVDGKPGSLDRGDKAYLAFVGQDLQMVFQIDTSAKISQLTLSFLEDVRQGILPPENVEVWGGETKNTLTRLGSVRSAPVVDKKPAAKGLMKINFPERTVKFVRIKAKNTAKLPAGHPLQKTTKAAIFVDEVSLE